MPSLADDDVIEQILNVKEAKNETGRRGYRKEGAYEQIFLLFPYMRRKDETDIPEYRQIECLNIIIVIFVRHFPSILIHC